MHCIREMTHSRNNMKLKKTTEIVPQTEANKLYAIEKELETIKDTYKAQIAPLEAKSSEIRASLLDSMRRTGIKTIKLETGDVYARTSRTTFKVVDEEKAYEWGEKNRCLRLDKIGANKILLRTIGVPEGFEQKDEEHITIKRAVQEQD